MSSGNLPKWVTTPLRRAGDQCCWDQLQDCSRRSAESQDLFSMHLEMCSLPRRSPSLLYNLGMGNVSVTRMSSFHFCFRILTLTSIKPLPFRVGFLRKELGQRMIWEIFLSAEIDWAHSLFQALCLTRMDIYILSQLEYVLEPRLQNLSENLYQESADTEKGIDRFSSLHRPPSRIGSGI